MRESRDSLREEISQNLNENLTEHEVITETIIKNDSVRLERIIDRTRTLESGSKFQDSRVVVRTIRDTVYIERKDTVEVQEVKLQGTGGSLNPNPSSLNLIKWIFALICAIIGLIITVKVCLLRR